MKISVIIYILKMFYGVYDQCRLISSVKKKKICSVATRELSGSCDVLAYFCYSYSSYYYYYYYV